MLDLFGYILCALNVYALERERERETERERGRGREGGVGGETKSLSVCKFVLVNEWEWGKFV